MNECKKRVVFAYTRIVSELTIHALQFKIQVVMVHLRSYCPNTSNTLLNLILKCCFRIFDVENKDEQFSIALIRCFMDFNNQILLKSMKERKLRKTAVEDIIRDLLMSAVNAACQQQEEPPTVVQFN